jgi:small-conductance mechanosensitive channel
MEGGSEMSDAMLHGILQMPPELWSNDQIDILQRHGRYLEAFKRIMELERERDEARRERDEALKECVLAQVGWSEALKQRDEARRERDEFRKNSLALVEELKKSVIRLAKERDEALESLSNVRRELVASNRGAETNAKVNQGLCARLTEAEREREEASSELVAVLKRRRWKEDLQIAFVLVFICMVAALCISTSRHEALKKEAVQRGYAEFAANADGALIWRWKEEVK